MRLKLLFPWHSFPVFRDTRFSYVPSFLTSHSSLMVSARSSLLPDLYMLVCPWFSTPVSLYSQGHLPWSSISTAPASPPNSTLFPWHQTISKFSQLYFQEYPKIATFSCCHTNPSHRAYLSRPLLWPLNWSEWSFQNETGPQPFFCLKLLQVIFITFRVKQKLLLRLMKSSKIWSQIALNVIFYHPPPPYKSPAIWAPFLFLEHTKLISAFGCWHWLFPFLWSLYGWQLLVIKIWA